MSVDVQCSVQSADGCRRWLLVMCSPLYPIGQWMAVVVITGGDELTAASSHRPTTQLNSTDLRGPSGGFDCVVWLPVALYRQRAHVFFQSFFSLAISLLTPAAAVTVAATAVVCSSSSLLSQPFRHSYCPTTPLKFVVVVGLPAFR